MIILAYLVCKAEYNIWKCSLILFTISFFSALTPGSALQITCKQRNNNIHLLNSIKYHRLSEFTLFYFQDLFQEVFELFHDHRSIICFQITSNNTSVKYFSFFSQTKNCRSFSVTFYIPRNSKSWKRYHKIIQHSRPRNDVMK